MKLMTSVHSPLSFSNHVELILSLFALLVTRAVLHLLQHIILPKLFWTAGAATLNDMLTDRKCICFGTFDTTVLLKLSLDCELPKFADFSAWSTHVEIAS